ncbi:mitochondrial outer membrane protein porin of 36 kDa isoform X1 [Daucus carota subsp. sativus]|uniref:mitochondrial outer membrane protein porin of 36 kDa isoform X1 n=1 Tax=Daucus carota subsp. sativus TaxID=79200 RepID=UPI0030835DA0
MAKGPGLYSDIGKKTRDLLFRDYQTDHKFTVSTVAANGLLGLWSGPPVAKLFVVVDEAITPSATKKGELLLADVNAQWRNNSVTTDLKLDIKSNLCTTITIDELAPGLKTILSFVAPDQKSGKVEVQYFHENAGISTSIGLAAKPLVNFSGVAGNNTVALGTDISFDTSTGDFTKYNVGLSISTADLIASFALNNKFDTLSASYMHTVSPLTNTAVGAELTHSFSSNENTLTIGTQHALDPLTSVKARVNNYGIASALIQHAWRPKSLVTISGEVDTKAIEKSAKVGIALALKP